MNFSRALIDGSVYTVIMAIFITLILRHNPRLEMKSYPKEIVSSVPPQTKEEKQEFKKIAIPPSIILILAVLFSGVQCYTRTEVSFLTLGLHYFIIFMMWNVFDLIIMDWLLFNLITPRYLVIPGSEGNPAYKDYIFNLIGSFKGTVISAVSALIVSSLAYLMLSLIFWN